MKNAWCRLQISLPKFCAKGSVFVANSVDIVVVFFCGNGF